MSQQYMLLSSDNTYWESHRGHNDLPARFRWIITKVIFKLRFGNYCKGCIIYSKREKSSE